MATQKVLVTIPLDDTKPITAEAEGHVGKACALELDALAQVLGGTSERTNKSEFYKEAKPRLRVRA